MREHGGHCDCEVLANLADLDDSLSEPATPAHIKPRRQTKQAARSLDTATGWDLSKPPAPWRVANLYAPAEPLRFEIGKKGGCSVEIVESRMPPGDEASDEFWSRLWYDRAMLPQKGKLHVSRGVLDLPSDLRSTLVRSSSWTPVLCWIFPQSDSWYLEARTESQRYAGDLPQIASLISKLANRQS